MEKSYAERVREIERRLPPFPGELVGKLLAEQKALRQALKARRKPK